MVERKNDLEIWYDPAKGVAVIHGPGACFMNFFRIKGELIIELHEGDTLLDSVNLGKRDVAAEQILLALSKRTLQGLLLD